MPFLTSLLVLLVASRLVGGLFTKWGQPAIVGEMVAGVLLGPSVFGWIRTTPPLEGISSLAVFLVVLSAGLEMNLKEVVRAMTGRGLVIAALGFVLPLAAGIALGTAFELDLMRTIFLGLCMSITALPVAVRILSGFKRLDTDIARYSIATAIVNDVTALLVLGVILSLPAGGEAHLPQHGPANTPAMSAADAAQRLDPLQPGRAVQSVHDEARVVSTRDLEDAVVNRSDHAASEVRCKACTSNGSVETADQDIPWSHFGTA